MTKLEELKAAFEAATPGEWPNGHLLRQVRNQFGPKWLEKL